MFKYLKTVDSVFFSSRVTKSPLDTKLSAIVHGLDFVSLNKPWSQLFGIVPRQNLAITFV